MRKTGAVLIGLLLVVGQVRTDEPQGKVVQEAWDAAYLQNAKVGFSHTRVIEVERDGQKLLRTSVEFNLTIKRYNTVVRLRVESGTEETPEGKVTGVFMTQFQDKGQKLALVGDVDDDGLHVKVDGGRIDKHVRWNDQVLGLYRQDRFFQDKKAKPGDKLSFLSYEPTINAVVTVRIAVLDPEEVDVLKVTPGAGRPKVERVRQRLLRVESKPDKVEAQGQSVQLPGMVAWLDKELLPVRSQMELPGLGAITLYRTTKEVATAPVAESGQLADLGFKTLIPLNRRLDRPHDTSQVVYRITVKGDEDPASTMARDARQEIKSIKGQAFELHVRAVRAPREEEADPGEPKAEFLKPCYYLDSDNAKVKELAREAVGDEQDTWRKAQAVERWVHDHMRSDNRVDFCPAGQVAKVLRGDCRQHAMLAAAMCRAAGVPSRTAVGLIYVEDPKRGPVLWFHMWFEVWVRGGWVALDATLGRGSVGAAHLKIADHSWYDTPSLTPMLPVSRVIGKLAVEIVRAE